MAYHESHSRHQHYTWDYIKGFVNGSFLVAACIKFALTVCPPNEIPYDNNVQRDFIAPSRLEIKCEDFDLNGEKETRLEVKDRFGNRKIYLLKEAGNKAILIEK